ncbi:MAG: fumarate hydratase [Deltaproteobacteria bacterium]|jgi:fumarate hydratase subunit alpha|nr:fumarate hydratase [Deltaproteobacteria bacterium]
MRVVSTQVISAEVNKLFRTSAYILPEKVKTHLAEALGREKSAQGKMVLDTLIKNHQMAQNTTVPLCQDTGLGQVIIELGQGVSLSGEGLFEAVNAGLTKAYGEGYLRKSTCHPLGRQNRGDNSPVSLETIIVPGDAVKIIVLAKGGGCDNKSKLTNLPPTASRETIVKTISSIALEAGPDACPPYFVGVSLGGSFESAPRLARRALVDIFEDPPMDDEENALAQEVLSTINASGLGPMGLGGQITALGLRLKLYPCHLASLPIAVNLNCHSLRTSRITL